LVLALLVAVVRPARADDETSQDHVRRATAAHDLGNYAEAAKEYEAAYMKSMDANLLVNVGQAWRMAGERQKALTAFRSYLRLAPSGEHVAFCEMRIQELEARARPAVLPVRPAPPPTPPPVIVNQPPPQVFVSTPPAPACPPSSPIVMSRPCPNPMYEAWPIWTAVGVLLVVGMIVGGAYLATDKDLGMPTTTFGTKKY
jgi:hypothetical protein